MKIILGSQSPRRKELLTARFGDESVDVISPLNDSELGFDGLSDVDDIEERLMLVVRQKLSDVTAQIEACDSDAILCADTIVVAEQSDGTAVVLGKPPQESWRATTKRWFETFYYGKMHEVWTGFVLAGTSSEPPGKVASQIVKTKVAIPKLSPDIIDWYLATEEPIGKAGGYGIQGHAASLIERVDGSLTNVIGLPMLEVADAVKQLQHSSTERGT